MCCLMCFIMVRTCGVGRTSRWRDRCHHSRGWDSWGGNTHRQDTKNSGKVEQETRWEQWIVSVAWQDEELLIWNTQEVVILIQISEGNRLNHLVISVIREFWINTESNRNGPVTTMQTLAAHVIQICDVGHLYWKLQSVPFTYKINTCHNC